MALWLFDCERVSGGRGHRNTTTRTRKEGEGKRRVEQKIASCVSVMRRFSRYFCALPGHLTHLTRDRKKVLDGMMDNRIMVKIYVED